MQKKINQVAMICLMLSTFVGCSQQIEPIVQSIQTKDRIVVGVRAKSKFEAFEGVLPSPPNVGGWQLNVQGLVGMPDDFSKAFVDYVSAASKLVNGKGRIPTRTHYNQPLFVGRYRGKTIANVVLHELEHQFPFVVDLSNPSTVPAEIVLCPSPSLIEKLYEPEYCSTKPIDLAKYADNRSTRISVSEFSLPSVESKLEALRGVEFARTDVSLPAGYTQLRLFRRALKSLQNGKAVFTQKLDYVLTWPDQIEENFVPIAMMASFSIDLKNSVVRRIELRTAKGEHESWYAFALVDANGAYSGLSPYVDSENNDFHRPLRLFPRQRRRYVDDEELQMADIHPLHLTPAPYFSVEDWKGEETFGEEWSIPSYLVDDGDFPIWKLSSDNLSKPWREYFTLSPCPSIENLQKPFPAPANYAEFNNPLWKMCVFSNAGPVTLVYSMALQQHVPKEQFPTVAEVHQALDGKWKRLQELSSTIMDSDRKKHN